MPLKITVLKFVLLGLLLSLLGGTSVFSAQAISARPAAGKQFPSLGGCPLFPFNNVWNRPITDLPVHNRSAAYIQSIGPNTGLHPDFGAGLWDGGPIGIPYTLANAGTPRYAVDFTYADQSDPVLYPIPANALIEGGPGSDGDRHILIVETSACVLYELYHAYPPNGGLGWQAGSGAVFDLRSNALRPETWTSADAAGLPILAGLARYDEVAAGHIDHALRFTVNFSQQAYVWPARHQASYDTNPNRPPMGLRFRLKAGFDTSSFPPQARVVLEALKKYGMIVADNGSNWYISGVPDERWDNDDLRTLAQVKGSNFEAVDESALNIIPDSALVPWYPGLPGVWLPGVNR